MASGNNRSPGASRMIKVKNLFDPVERSDGQRLWVEPFGLTRDLRGWCSVDHILPHLGPSMQIWNVLQEHPDAFDYFQAHYHDQLKASPHKAALHALARAGLQEDFTLIHSGEDDERNAAVALQNFLNELAAYPKA